LQLHFVLFGAVETRDNQADQEAGLFENQDEK
jgi:hypothetical protein